MNHVLVAPPESTALLVLAHGAGAGMHHPFLERMAQALAEHLRQPLEKRMAHPRPGTVREHQQRLGLGPSDEDVIHPYRILPRRSGGNSLTTMRCCTLRLPTAARTVYSPGTARRSSSAEVGSPRPRGRGRS